MSVGRRNLRKRCHLPAGALLTPSRPKARKATDVTRRRGAFGGGGWTRYIRQRGASVDDEVRSWTSRARPETRNGLRS